MANIKDVATRAGVSLGAASYALSGKKPVSDDVRRRVMAAAAELGYQPSALGRSLRHGRSHRIGLLSNFPSEASGWRVMEMLHAAEEEASAHGYSVSFVRSNGQPIQALELVEKNLVDGLILVQVKQRDERVELLRKRGVPFVLIGRTSNPEGLSFVDHDAAHGVHRGLEYLAQLGHQRIAYLAPLTRSVTQDLGRDIFLERGFQQAAAELNATLYRIEVGATTEDGFHATQALLRQHPDITAIFTTQSNTQYGVLHALYAQQLRVPRDVSVLGISSDSGAECAVPPLTAISAPLQEMGRLAARQLVDILERDAKPAQLILTPRLVLRESTAPPPAKAATKKTVRVGMTTS
jgi:DNA-binding LacI/PurR family transcriptional regulator